MEPNSAGARHIGAAVYAFTGRERGFARKPYSLNVRNGLSGETVLL